MPRQETKKVIEGHSMFRCQKSGNKKRGMDELEWGKVGIGWR